MIHLIGPLLILFSFTAEARFSVGRTPKGEIILNVGCGEAQKELNTLINWTKKVEKRSCKPNKITESAEGMCVSDITNCVPGHVQKYQGLTSADNGPNCWNLALVMGGLMPMLRESSADEWEFYVSSPLCRELLNGEKPQMGDLGSVETRTKSDKGHVHGFMYVSPSIVYSKNGTSLESPYSLQSLEDMEAVYNVGGMMGECQSDCGEVKLQDFMKSDASSKYPHGVPGAGVCYLDMKLDKVLTKACGDMKAYLKKRENNCRVCVPSTVHYYRCQTFDEYFSKQNFAQKERLKKVDDIVKKTESCTQNMIFGEDTAGHSRDLLVDNLKILNAYLGRQPKWEAQKKEEKFVLARFALRLKELEDVIEGGNHDNELSQLFQEALGELK